MVENRNGSYVCCGSPVSSSYEKIRSNGVVTFSKILVILHSETNRICKTEI